MNRYLTTLVLALAAALTSIVTAAPHCEPMAAAALAAAPVRCAPQAT